MEIDEPLTIPKNIEDCFSDGHFIYIKDSTNNLFRLLKNGDLKFIAFSVDGKIGLNGYFSFNDIESMKKLLVGSKAIHKKEGSDAWTALPLDFNKWLSIINNINGMIDINKLSLEVNNVIYCIKNEGTYYAIIKGFDGYVTGVVSDDGTFDETKRHSEIFSVNGISIHNDKLVLASSEGIHFRYL